MACERCGAPIAANICRIYPSLSTPNGRAIFGDLVLSFYSDALRTKAVFFCEPCYGGFLEMFAEVGHALRLNGVTSTAQGTQSRPGS